MANSVAAERDRWALWLPVGLGAGIGFYFLLPSEPGATVAPVALAVAVLTAIAARRRSGVLLAAALGTAFASAGFTVAQFRTSSVAAPVLERRIGPVTVDGRVIELEQREVDFRLTLDRVAIGRLAPDRTPARVRVQLRALPAGLVPGHSVRLRAILAPPPGPAAPGAFDFARQAWFVHLGAVGFAVGPADIRAVDDARHPWSVALSRLRSTTTDRILVALDGPRGAVAAALMTGQRSAIPADVLGAMRDSGLAHLLAISGLHVGLVAGILFFALRLVFAAIEPLALRRPVKKWAALGALLGAFCYLLISGATVPTQRAFVMLAVVLVAVMLDRTALSMRLVAFAAVLVLILAPESLLSASFQLSFAAVIALIAAYEALAPRLAAWRGEGGAGRRVVVYIAGIALTTLIAGLATAPFALYHFNRVALYGVVANLVAVPLAGFWIMPWAMVAFALMPLGLEQLGLAPMGWGITAVIWIAQTVAGWPGASALLPAMPPTAIGVIALGGLWLCLWRTRWRLAGIVPILAGLATVPMWRGPDVLIDGTGRLLAVRSGDGALALSSQRVARFDGEVWLRRSGTRQSAAWPAKGVGAGGRLACDGLGCIYRAGGTTVALVRHPAALLEDCFAATVVIAAVPVRRRNCRMPARIIDRFDLWRRGAHALWLDGDEIRIESVAQRRGVRPWSPVKVRARRSQ